MNRDELVETIYESGDVDGMIETWLAEYDRLTALNKQLVEAVKAAKSSETSDECRADHHGYCQSHGNDPIERCWVKLCEAAIRATEESSRGEDSN